MPVAYLPHNLNYRWKKKMKTTKVHCMPPHCHRLNAHASNSFNYENCKYVFAQLFVYQTIQFDKI